MKCIISDLIEEKKTSVDIEPQTIEEKVIYKRDFEIKYEILNPILKDAQMMTLLIKFIKSYQFSDLIFITGNSTCSVDSRFYFNYRKIADFYFHVINFEEKENFMKISYNVYKTKPISLNFIITVFLIKVDNNSKLEIEIIPPKGKKFPEKIANIIYNELDYNFIYLSLALKLKKDNLLFFNSSIIQNEFFILSQIFQNIKLIEYLINGKLKNVTNEKNNTYDNLSNEKNKFIQKNDIYKILLSKEKAFLNNINFKIINIKSKEDKLIINIKILTDEEKNDSNINQTYNIISIIITKITKNSTFILIKCIFDSNFDENRDSSVKKILKKIFGKIQKLSDLSKNKNSF